MAFYNKTAKRAAAAIGQARREGREAARKGKDYFACEYNEAGLRNHWNEAFEDELRSIADRTRQKIAERLGFKASELLKELEHGEA